MKRWLIRGSEAETGCVEDIVHAVKEENVRDPVRNPSILGFIQISQEDVLSSPPPNCSFPTIPK